MTGSWQAAFTKGICALLLLPVLALAQDAGDEPTDGEQDGANATPQLITRVVEVTGTVMARAGDDGEWQKVEKDQTLPVGAQLRTGVRGSVVMEVGPNAVVNVDRLSELTIGRLEHDPQTNTIRTFLGVKFGKVDFHVKHVGFENDFRIASPSDVMAVRGTIGTFKAYEGPAEISGASSNGVGAIAGQSRNTNTHYQLSQNEAVEGGERDPKKTQQNQQNVGNKLGGGGSFNVNQYVSQGGQTSLRGKDSLMNAREQFVNVGTTFPSLYEFCDPTSPNFDIEKCRRVAELIGQRYRSMLHPQIAYEETRVQSPTDLIRTSARVNPN